jgi:hypothetical protein
MPLSRVVVSNSNAFSRIQHVNATFDGEHAAGITGEIEWRKSADLVLSTKPVYARSVHVDISGVQLHPSTRELSAPFRIAVDVDTSAAVSAAGSATLSGAATEAVQVPVALIQTSDPAIYVTAFASKQQDGSYQLAVVVQRP